MAKVKQIIRPVVKQFQIKKCGFEHLPADDFVKSQWQNCTKSLAYLIYRWIIAIFFIGVVITSLVTTFMDGRYFIYLTNWGILLCMSTTLLGAVIVSIWHFHPDYADRVTDSDSMPISFKIYWGMHINTLILSMVITIVYWTVLHNNSVPLTATNILSHAFNAIGMFTDLLIVAYPIRLLHVFLPISFGITFVIFSVIYYAAGGVDVLGNHYIYPVLDWSKPNSALETVFGVLFLCVILYIFIFAVYKLRTFIYKRYKRNKMFIPTTTAAENQSAITFPSQRISMVFGNDNKAFTGSTDKIGSS